MMKLRACLAALVFPRSRDFLVPVGTTSTEITRPQLLLYRMTEFIKLVR